MISQAIFNTALRFGIGFTALQAMLLLLSRWMDLNPYGALRMWPLYMLPVFIFLGLRYLKQFEVGKNLSYSSAFRTGSMITFFGSACSSMLLYVFGMLAEPAVLARHQAEMKEMISLTEDQLNDVFGQENMKRALEQMQQITPGSIAYEDFFMKLVLGTIAALILAFFFRTRNPQPAQ